MNLARIGSAQDRPQNPYQYLVKRPSFTNAISPNIHQNSVLRNLRKRFVEHTPEKTERLLSLGQGLTMKTYND